MVSGNAAVVLLIKWCGIVQVTGVAERLMLWSGLMVTSAEVDCDQPSSLKIVAELSE